MLSEDRRHSDGDGSIDYGMKIAAGNDPLGNYIQTSLF